MGSSCCPLLLVTVRHSGSHSALGIFEQHYTRYTLTEKTRPGNRFWFCHAEPSQLPLIHKRMDGSFMVLTMRNPMDVARSWIKRRVTMDHMFRAMWENLFSLQKKYNGFWLPMDIPQRDEYLHRISQRAGCVFKTDWQPKNVSGDNHPYREGMTLEDCQAFFTEFDFKEFGYEL